MKWWVCILTIAIVCGCTSPQDKAIHLAQAAGWKWSSVQAGDFDLATAQPAGQHADTLRIYLEGDGRAYLTPTRASSDPTPTDPVGLKLALAQPTGYAAYLARPCQYGQKRGCNKSFWTNARYAQEIIASTNLAIDTLKKNAGSSRIILVGYSGGGALAVLAAAARNDVAGIITIAANLDLAYWTEHNGLSPLTGSVDPSSVADKVAAISQMHFTGADDKVTGTKVAQAFVNRLPAGAPVRVVEIPGFTHACCWVEAWPQLLSELGPNF